MRALKLSAVLIVVFCGLLGERHLLAAQPVPPQTAGAGVPVQHQTLAFAFEPNRGQAVRGVRFLARINGYTLAIADTGLLMTPARTARPSVGLSFEKANPHPVATPLERLRGQVNYFIGNNPRLWRRHIPTFARVLYRNVYPHVDVTFYGHAGNLEYDWVLHPGADPTAIRLHVSDASARLDRSGNIALDARSSNRSPLRFLIRAPHVYQWIGGMRRRVTGRFSLLPAGRIGVTLGQYDRSKPLVIDPTIELVTFLGGAGTEVPKGIATDGTGSSYIAGGVVGSTGFPLQSAFSSVTNGTEDAFVTKLDRDGNLIYSTFLGGNAVDEAHGIVVDAAGKAYITGATSSPIFPISHAVQPAIGGGNDAFVTALDPTGSSLLFSTYLGGQGTDSGNAIALDALGRIYIAGYSTSKVYPTLSPIQANPGGGSLFGDAVLTELSPSGSQFLFSTYFGGSADDAATAVRVDSQGTIYLAGFTRSANFRTVNPLPGEATLHTGSCGPAGAIAPCRDAFLARISAAHVLISSTLLGGSSDDYATSLAVDGSDNVYVGGVTSSSDFPVQAAVQSTYGGGTQDGFVVELDTAGTLMHSTFLGGTLKDTVAGVATLGDSVYIAGDSQTAFLPLVNPPPIGGAFHAATCGTASNVIPCADAFLAAIDGSGRQIKVGFYLGGTADDLSAAIATDSSGFIYFLGSTNSQDLPVAHAFQRQIGGSADAFVARIAEAPVVLTLTPTPTPTPIPTDTPVPTATPTATPKPASKKCRAGAHRVNGLCKCKKGYVRVKGKCVKKKMAAG